MNDTIELLVAYDQGYAAGKQAMIYEIEDILDRCANDNAEMICKALKDLIKKKPQRRG